MSWVARSEDLTVRFRIRGSRDTVKALTEVSIDVPASGAVGLIGESGSGKTTLGRCIAGLTRPTAGRCEVAETEGRPVRVQMLFQDPESSLDPRLTIRQSIDEMRRRAAGAASATELLQTVGLPAGLADHRPKALDPAQQQRAALARALAAEPELLILDEPVTALDLDARADILALLRRIRAERGVALLYISHDLSTVRFLCDEVAVMYLGRIVERGAARAILAAPLHPYTLALLSSSLSPDPRIRSTPYLLDGEIPSAVRPPSGCALHPRCPRSSDRCAAELPPLARTEVSAVACWHPIEDGTRRLHLSGAPAAAVEAE